MFRVQVQLPPDADPAVVEALRAVGVALGVEVEETSDAPAETYGLTVHALPDPKEE
jgi:hypothetical protein